MQNKFIIFSPSGEKPHSTLAIIQGEPDENGRVDCQAIVEGKNSELLAAFSAITDALLNHCHIPFLMVLSAFRVGCEGMNGAVINKEGEDNKSN